MIRLGAIALTVTNGSFALRARIRSTDIEFVRPHTALLRILAHDEGTR